MSPPPEEEWAPCLRMVAGSSECVPRGTVFVVTQEGAQLGREPGGANPVSLREVQVSKAHVDIRFSRTNGCFTICDLASQNGTFLNNARISEPKTESKPHPINHNDILEIGTTSFTLHIHSGWDTCEFCRWEERGGGEEGMGKEGRGSWKTELNRIKKRYGLRMKDTYGEDPVRASDGYVDRAAGRRQTVGSDMPDVGYLDAAPASVHRAIGEESVGHKMLKKLGWKKGEGLGKGSKGRTEPVTAEVREVRSGLGSGGGGKRSLDAAGGGESAAKHARLVKHYSQVVARESDRSRRQ
ncbi:Angiogenic factor with G patch and FHA domains 1 [Geodia barretti]|nr:Angiogenic factor with G patch and FHA domains 1 [Geodia barretti]